MAFHKMLWVTDDSDFRVRVRARIKNATSGGFHVRVKAKIKENSSVGNFGVRVTASIRNYNP